MRYDLPRLGRLDGLDVVHLQCHIGTDTVSLARLGARSVTGSTSHRRPWRRARASPRAPAPTWTSSRPTLYDAVDALGAECFDVVYTGIGALCWLPDIRRWAGVVAGLLRPGGRLFIREGHPCCGRCAIRARTACSWSSTRTSRPTEHLRREDTYAGTGVVASPESVIVQPRPRRDLHGAARGGADDHGVRGTPGGAVEPLRRRDDPSQDFDGEFVLADGRDRMPLTYTLQAVKASALMPAALCTWQGRGTARPAALCTWQGRGDSAARRCTLLTWQGRKSAAISTPPPATFCRMQSGRHAPTANLPAVSTGDTRAPPRRGLVAAPAVGGVTVRQRCHGAAKLGCPVLAPPADPAAFRRALPRRRPRIPIGRHDSCGLPSGGRWPSLVGAADDGALTCRTYQIAELHFADPDALQAAFGSDQGKATAADYAQIAPPGSRMFIAVAD